MPAACDLTITGEIRIVLWVAPGALWLWVVGCCGLDSVFVVNAMCTMFLVVPRDQGLWVSGCGFLWDCTFLILDPCQYGFCSRIGDLLAMLGLRDAFWCFVGLVFVGEFDPGSGRTLAACLTHASRTERPFGVLEWRTGE